jgi:hypothetical protein
MSKQKALPQKLKPSPNYNKTFITIAFLAMFTLLVMTDKIKQEDVSTLIKIFAGVFIAKKIF